MTCLPSRCTGWMAFIIFTVSYAAVATAQSGAQFPILQPIADHSTHIIDPVLHQDAWYVPLVLDYVRWGYLPNQTAKPLVTVPSGSLVTMDVVSHEGVLEDQGRDPVRFFGQHGIPRNEVLVDAIRVAAPPIRHDFFSDGPHVVSPPVAVSGAQPGDILRIDVVALTPRVPYGVTSIRHGKGALPETFPQTPPSAGRGERCASGAVSQRFDRDSDPEVGQGMGRAAPNAQWHRRTRAASPFPGCDGSGGQH